MTTWLSISLIKQTFWVKPLYTIQLVAQPVVQHVGQPVVSCRHSFSFRFVWQQTTGMGTWREWPRPRPRRDQDVGLTSWDETETRRLNFETRQRRDVCRSRDVTETLKCTLSGSSKQVNVGLTTVAAVPACLLVSWCILDFCVFNGSDYVLTVLYGTTTCWHW